MIALDLKIFQNKLENSLGIKMLKHFCKNTKKKIQGYYSIMCGYFCIALINFIIKSKSLSEYEHLFSPREHKYN